MEEQLAVRRLLQSKFDQGQAKNPSYSLRSFANKLGVGAGPLSQVLSGNRKVSRKMAERFCEALMLDPAERADVLKYFSSAISSTSLDSVDHDEYLKLSADQFKVMSDWYYYGILSLTKTVDFKNDATWIAGRLGISKVEASQALDRLFRLNLLETKNGKVSQVKPRYRTTDDIAQTSVRKAHHQTLELARESLDRDSVEERDFTTMTMPTHPEKLKGAKELIRKFQQELCKLMMDTKKPTEVYRVSVELFPLTQLSGQKKTTPKTKPSLGEN